MDESMDELAEQHIYCPYCGERLSVLIEPQDAGSEYIEDCQVCCRPIVFLVSADGEQVEVRAENE